MKCRDDFVKLADAMRTAPRFIADVFGVNPDLLIRLLKRRGEIADDESLEFALAKHYGERVLRECERLVCVCPFEED